MFCKKKGVHLFTEHVWTTAFAIRKNLKLGYLECVKSVVTLEVQAKEFPKEKITIIKATVCEVQQTPEISGTNKRIQMAYNSIDLSSLKDSEREKVRHVTSKDAIVFFS